MIYMPDLMIIFNYSGWFDRDGYLFICVIPRIPILFGKYVQSNPT